MNCSDHRAEKVTRGWFICTPLLQYRAPTTAEMGIPAPLIANLRVLTLLILNLLVFFYVFSRFASRLSQWVNEGENQGPSKADRARDGIPENAKFHKSYPTHDVYVMEDDSGTPTAFHRIKVAGADGVPDPALVAEYRAYMAEEKAAREAFEKLKSDMEDPAAPQATLIHPDPFY